MKAYFCPICTKMAWAPFLSQGRVVPGRYLCKNCYRDFTDRQLEWFWEECGFFKQLWLRNWWRLVR